MLAYVDDLSVPQEVFVGCGGSRYQSRGKKFFDAFLRNSQLNGLGGDGRGWGILLSLCAFDSVKVHK